MKKTLLCISMLFSFIFLNAQENEELNFCGSQHDAEAEAWLTKFFAGDVIINKSDETVWVPMTTHLVSPTTGQTKFDEHDILDAMCTLNSDFSETGIQFYLSSIELIVNDDYYDHDYSDGIKMMQENNIDYTANSYFVSSPAGNCGYFAPSGGAVALSFSCNNKFGHTWAHEMGHYLSLPHTFRGWEGTDYVVGQVAPEVINNRKVERAEDDPDCEKSGDRFCDTPADYLSFRWNCNTIGESSELQTDPDSVTFRSDGSYFMTYSNPACKDKFSSMQSDAMMSNLLGTKANQINENYILGSELKSEDTYGIFPIDDELITSSSTTLQWEELEEAEFYYLEVSRFPGYQQPLVKKLVTGKSFEVESLKTDKTYYWRLTAYSSDFFCPEIGNSHTFKTSIVTTTSSEEWSDVYVYPNPSRNVLTINSSKNLMDQIKIYDSSMRVVGEESFAASNSVKYNHSLSNGIYFVQISNSSSSTIQKIVVEK